MDVALKKLGYDNNTNWINLEPCISPGFLYLPCMYQFEGDLQMIPNEVEYQLKVFEVKETWYTKVKQMYEHIVYELRYEHLNSIEHGSIYMKAQFI